MFIDWNWEREKKYRLEKITHGSNANWAVYIEDRHWENKNNYVLRSAILVVKKLWINRLRQYKCYELVGIYLI